MKISLLDYLALKAFPTLLSDLKRRPDLYVHAVCSLNKDSFSLSEWNEAGSYLLEGYKNQPDCEAARMELLRLAEEAL